LHLLFVASDGVRWVVKAPMMSVQLTGENRADLVRVTANRDDGLDGLMEKVVHVLRGITPTVKRLTPVFSNKHNPTIAPTI